jgi:acetyl esterase/lipase
MGSSAGGHLAAVVARRARDDPSFSEHPITGQLLQIPSICHPDHHPEQYVHKNLCSAND